MNEEFDDMELRERKLREFYSTADARAMKCESCKFMYADFGVPSPDVSCSKGHWSIPDFTITDDDHDPHKDCIDYVEIQER